MPKTVRMRPVGIVVRGTEARDRSPRTNGQAPEDPRPPRPQRSAQPGALAAHRQWPPRDRDLRKEIHLAVESPTAALPGREPDEEWLYLEGAGPSRWLKVVVVFDSDGSGRIITAFARRRKP